MSNSKLKLGLFGAGHWGRNLLNAGAQLSPADGELAVVCEQSDEILKGIRESHPRLTVTKDMEECLNSVDAVLIATPAVTHYDVASRALRAGKHCFVEKPLSLTLDDAQKLYELAAQKDLLLMPDHLLLFHPAVEKIDNQIMSGDLGRVLYTFSERLNLGIVRTDENALWSLAPHDIYLSMQLVGARPQAVSVWAEKLLPQNLEDMAFAKMYYEDVTSHFHVSWLHPQKVRRLTVVGDKKMAVFSDTAEDRLRIYDKNVTFAQQMDPQVTALVPSIRYGEVSAPHIGNPNVLKLILANFCRVIQGREKPRALAVDALNLVAILTAAQQSIANRGAAVEITYPV